MSSAKLACKWFSVILLTSVVLVFGFSQTDSPPEILEIVFPHETISADGSRHSGKVVFKDADGDAEWADFHVEAPNLQALSIDGKTPENGVVRLEVLAPADRQKQGQGIVLFKIAATAPQEVTIRVVLTDEAGNASDPSDPKATFSFTVRGLQPDLVASLGELPERIQIGQTLEASYTVQNLGGSDSGPFRVGIYLSADATLTPQDFLLASQETGNLGPDASAIQHMRLAITEDALAQAGLQAGQLFLGVIADDLDQVTESDETNNVASSAIQVELPPKRPVITSIEFPKEIPADGSRITGKVHFKDPDGNINLISFEVIAAKEFKPFSFNPYVQGLTEGSIGFFISCYTVQEVTLEVMLSDEGGNRSPPEEFTFSCVQP
jgi:hypothetical protein